MYRQVQVSVDLWCWSYLWLFPVGAGYPIGLLYILLIVEPSLYL